MAKCMQVPVTYLSSWKVRKAGEALQFAQVSVNNKDISCMSKHTALTQTDAHSHCAGPGECCGATLFILPVSNHKSYLTLFFIQGKACMQNTCSKTRAEAVRRSAFSPLSFASGHSACFSLSVSFVSHRVICVVKNK